METNPKVEKPVTGVERQFSLDQLRQLIRDEIGLAQPYLALAKRPHALEGKLRDGMLIALDGANFDLGFYSGLGTYSELLGEFLPIPAGRVGQVYREESHMMSNAAMPSFIITSSGLGNHLVKTMTDPESPGVFNVQVTPNTASSTRHSTALQLLFSDPTKFGPFRYTCVIRGPATLGDATVNKYKLWIGVADTLISTTNPTVCYCFNYDPAVSANWRVAYKMLPASTIAYFDTGIAVATNTLKKMEVFYSAVSNMWYAVIDSVVVHSIANTMGAGTPVMAGEGAVSNAGSGGVAVTANQLDAVGMWFMAKGNV